MADVQLQTKSDSRKGRKRLTARVDLTPMVDLAFLLITFFMLTTTLQEKYAMKLKMPDTTGNPENYPESAMLTFILDKKDIIWYYPGDEYLALKKTDYTSEGLRQLIYDKQKIVKEKFYTNRELICIIKVTDDANYKNLVDILDEMVITDVYSYAMQDLTEEENLAIKQQL
ncbi:MAG: biopolymer transporter ExbD [Fimbriimonadaceae bacterium]|nr:biopolymer transporter ExbD [Chitinophagales bacterium]